MSWHEYTNGMTLLSNAIVSDEGREFKKRFRLTLKPMDKTYYCTMAFQIDLEDAKES